MSERMVEIPWALAHSEPPVLDVGCAESDYLSDLPGPVDGIDVRLTQRTGLRTYYVDDIRTWLPPVKYRTVLAVSTLEHIGLAHTPYGTIADDEDGDRHALTGCVAACQPGGRVLLTVPFGVAGHHGWYRSYSERTLAELLRGCDWTAEYHPHQGWAGGGVALVTVTL